MSESEYYTSDATGTESRKGKKKIKFPFRKKKKKAGDASDSSIASSVNSRDNTRSNPRGVGVEVVNVAVQQKPPSTPTRNNAESKTSATEMSSGRSDSSPFDSKNQSSENSALGNANQRNLPVFSHQKISDENSLSDDSSVSSSGSKISSASWKLNTNIARTKFNLGQVYMVKRMHDKAQQSFEEALAARTKLHGSMHPEVAKVHEMLGKLAERREGSTELAMKHYQEALFIYSMAEMLQDEPVTKRTQSDEMSISKKEQAKKMKKDKKKSMKTLSKKASAVQDIEELKEKIAEVKSKVSFSKAADSTYTRSTVGLAAAALTPTGKRDSEEGSSYKSLPSDSSMNDNMSLSSVGNDDNNVNLTNQTWQECLDAAEKYMRHGNYQVANKCLKTCLRLLLSEGTNTSKDINDSSTSFLDDDYSSYGANDDTVGHVRWKMGVCEAVLGNLNDSQRHFQVSLRLLRPKLGNHDEKIASILFDYGDMYRQLNDMDQALECFSECLTIRSKLFGDNHKDTTAILQKCLQTLSAAADIAVEDENVDQAITHRKDLLNLLETKYDQTAYETKKERTKQLILLAHVILLKRGWEEALQYLATAKNVTNEFAEEFKDQERSMGLLKAQTMISINSLQAFVYEKKKKYEEALNILEEAIFYTGEIYGTNSEQYAKLLSSQGIVYAKMQRGDEAITSFKRSTTIYVSCQANVNYDDYIRTLDTMISIYMERGQAGIAKMILQDKLATGIQFKGERSTIVATTYKELGIMNFQEDQFEDALRNFKQSVDIGSYVYKSDDEEFITCLRYFAVTNDILGNNDDALTTYQEILDLVSDSSKLPFHNAVGYICNKSGRHDEALDHLNKALVFQQAYDNNDNDDNPSIEYNRLMKHLGNVYASLGQETDAFYCYDRVIEKKGSSKTLQDERLTSIFNKSKVLCEKKEYLKAKSVLKQGLHLAKSHQKNEHIRLLWSSLGTVEFKLGKYQKSIKCFKQAMNKADQGNVPNKNDIGMRFNMGLAYWKLGLSYNAITVFQKCLEELETLNDTKSKELAELKADIIYNMGNMYLKENQLKEANAFFVKGEHLGTNFHLLFCIIML